MVNKFLPMAALLALCASPVNAHMPDNCESGLALVESLDSDAVVIATKVRRTVMRGISQGIITTSDHAALVSAYSELEGLSLELAELFEQFGDANDQLRYCVEAG